VDNEILVIKEELDRIDEARRCDRVDEEWQIIENVRFKVNEMVFRDEESGRENEVVAVYCKQQKRVDEFVGRHPD